MKIKMTEQWTAILPEALRCLRDKWESLRKDTREIGTFLREFQLIQDKIKEKEDTNGITSNKNKL